MSLFFLLGSIEQCGVQRNRGQLNKHNTYDRRMQQIYLNFHGLGCPPPHVDDGERAYWLEPKQFSTFLGIAQRYEQEHQQVLITFDDGNKSDVDIALGWFAWSRPCEMDNS
jgi:hypothetical protein